MHTDDRGFTLVELIVVMAVFIAVISMAASTFNTIIRQSSGLVQGEESNIEGVIGLEIFRHDLEQAGFGLPSSFLSTPPSYNEASAAPASSFNEQSTSPENAVPRPVLAGNNVSTSGVLANTDYLVIKGTTVGHSPASQRWTYVNYSSSGKAPKTWTSANLVKNDRVVVLRRAFTDTGVTNQLVYNTASPQTFFTKIPDPNTPLPTAFSPVLPQEVFTLYGVDTADLRMPFNRADYFVSRPAAAKLPARCAPNTGILYKAVVNHTNNGATTTVPLLDCVADMQVVFAWDLSGDGLIDAYSDADGSNVSGGTSAQVQPLLAAADGLRGALKLIKVYVLAQEGREDTNFTNSASTIAVGGGGEINLTKGYDLNPTGGPNLMHYHWKVYRIVIKPKNLSAQ